MGPLSRKYRTRFIYAFHLNNKKIFLLLLLLVFNLALWGAFMLLETQIHPAASALATSKASIAATELINDSVTQVIDEDGITYGALNSINKNEQGEIISITSDTMLMNRLKTRITSVLIDKIKNMDYADIGIPVGNLFNSYLLTGRGPKIPVRLLTTGSVQVDFENTFAAAGINQTKHTVTVCTSMDVQVLLPSGTATTTVSTSTPILETIIVGNTPNVYVER